MGETAEQVHSWCIDLDSETFWSLVKVPDRNLVIESLYSDDESLSVTSWTGESQKTQVLSYFNLAQEKRAASAGMEFGALAIGVLIIDSKLISLTKFFETHPILLSKGDSGFPRLTAHDGQGTSLSVETDPQKDFLPISIKYTLKTGQSQLEIVYLVVESDCTNGVWFPKKVIVHQHKPALRQELPPNYRFLDGVVVLTSKDIGENYVELPPVVVKNVYTYLDLVLSTEKKFIETPIADGTPVHLQDAPHLDFAWIAGGIVGVADVKIIQMDVPKFTRESSPNLKLILILLGFVAILFFRFFYKNRWFINQHADVIFNGNNV